MTKQPQNNKSSVLTAAPVPVNSCSVLQKLEMRLKRLESTGIPNLHLTRLAAGALGLNVRACWQAQHIRLETLAPPRRRTEPQVTVQIGAAGIASLTSSITPSCIIQRWRQDVQVTRLRHHIHMQVKVGTAEWISAYHSWLPRQGSASTQEASVAELHPVRVLIVG